MGKLGSFNTRQGANYIGAGSNMHKAAADRVAGRAGSAPRAGLGAPAPRLLSPGTRGARGPALGAAIALVSSLRTRKGKEQQSPALFWPVLEGPSVGKL